MAEFSIRELHRLLADYLPPERDYSTAGHLNIKRFAPVIDFNEVVNQIITEKSLKLDLIWGTCTYSILNVQQFLTILTNEADALEECRKLLIKMMSNQLKNSRPILDAFLLTLIQIKFNYSRKNFSQQLENVVEELLETFTTNILQKINHKSSNECINIYEVVARNQLIDCLTLQKYFASQILRLMSSNSMDKKYTLQDVIASQNEWIYLKVDSFTRSLIFELLSPFNSKEIENLIRQILDLPNINWKMFLVFISHFLVLYENGPEILRDFNTNLLRESLANSDANKVTTALILTRQAVHEGTHVHSSYEEWIKATFHENVSPANNKKTFSQFMKIISDLVPHEPAGFLKAHILNHPFIPNNCRCYFNDYVTLAKTRLQDLGDFDVRIFKYGDQSTMQNEDIKAKVNKDVDEMIKAFEENGRVPGRVIELSIFRKPYYSIHFLPALMTPDNNETRRKFVNTLHKAGKIPNQLHQKYISDCNKLQNKGTSSTATRGSVNSELKSLFEELPEKIINGVKLNDNFFPENHLQEIGKILSLLLKKDVNGGKELIYLNSTNITIDLEIKQIVNLLILSFSKTLCAVTNLDVSHKWADELLLLISPFRLLQQSLYFRLWEILTKLGSTLQDHQIWVLSALLVHLGSLQQSFHPVTISNEERDIASVIVTCCPCDTDEQIQILLSFCSYYLQYAFLRYSSFSINHSAKRTEAYIPKVLIQKYSLVAQLYPDTQSSNCPLLIRTVYNSKEYFDLYNSTFN